VILFRRPAVAPNFEATVAARRLLVQQAVDTQVPPEFADLWGAFKPQFDAAQFGKCGYCEIAVTAGQDGDVEHFAPKSELMGLGPNPDEWGREAPNSSRVTGRRLLPLSDSGYWWLAYDWTNYLLACAVCNRKWKRTVFPVQEPPIRTVPPRQAVVESALLLNPFGRARPATHLRFNEDGSVETRNGSRRGLETIKTVGLDRPSIRLARRPFASDAYQALREFSTAVDAADDVGQTRALGTLVRIGSPDRQFAGVVRAIVQQELSLSWSDVEAAAAGPP
jgi:hypothetical protein